jgi:PAS domain S-box-containing protein
MEQLFAILNLFVIFTILVFLVFLYTRSSAIKVARYLAHVFISVSGWLIFEYLGSSLSFPNNLNVIFWRITFFFVFLMTVLMLRFIAELVQAKLNKYFFWLVAIIQGSFALLSVSTDFIIFEMQPVFSIYGKEYEAGRLFVFGAISIVAVMSLCLFFLFKRFWAIRKDKDRGESRSLFYIFLGIAIPLIIGSITNLLFPLLKINFPKLVSPGVFIMVLLFMYSIYQWQAFSITVSRLKINLRIVLLFLLSAGITILVGVILFINQINILLNEEINSQLTTRLESRSGSIGAYVIENDDFAQTLSSLYAVTEYLAVRDEGSDPDNISILEMRARNLLGQIKTINSALININLINKDREVFFTLSSASPPILTVEDRKRHLQDDSLVSQIKYCDNDQAYCFDIFHPIFIDNKFLGGVEITVKADKIFYYTSNSLNPRTGEELYLMDQDGYIFSPLQGKNIDDTFLKVNAGADAIANCLKQKSISNSTVVSYDNYDGRKVSGVFSYVDALNACLVGEIKVGSFGEYTSGKIMNNLIIGILIILGLMIVFGRLVANTISKPLVKLQEDVKIIEQGDYNHKVGTEARDEIGELSRAFDKMTSAIKRSREDVDRKVKEQTKDIIEKQELLEGQQKAVLNVLEDVEKEKDLTLRERDKIDTIIHSIGDGVFVIDEKYRIVLYNEVAAEISGYKADEAIGKRFDEILKFVDAKDNKTSDNFIFEVIKTGENREMSNRTLLINKAGQKIPVSDSAAPVKEHDGRVVGCVVVFRDVTKEREIDRAKTEFVSLSSHQLRTPLTSISWYTEMLMSGDAGKVNSEQKEYLEEIFKGTHRMVDLVNSLLNVSRIELGTFAVEPEPVDMIKTCQEMIKEMQPTIIQKKLSIETKFGNDVPIINADRKLATIIFQNLISNAVKYTPENGKITVEISKKDPNLLIKVADNGYGIPWAARDKIFTKLYRADNVRAKDTTGTGLGLYIVKSIVEKAEGKVWFESQENKGTTFYVELPLSGFKQTEGLKKLS